MRRRIATAVTGALVLTVLTVPAARADLSSPATIVSASVDSGSEVVLGPDSRATIRVSFTARDDSGFPAGGADAVLFGPNGKTLYRDPYAGPPCTAVSSTTSVCRFTFTVDTADPQIGNDHAGTWRLWALAAPNDSVLDQGVVTRTGLATVRIKRQSRLTMDATPEPVRAGQSLGIIGALKFADWDNGGYTGTAGHPVRLAFYPDFSPIYEYVQDLDTTRYGWVLTTTLPDRDGSWFLTYRGTETTSWVYSAADHVDVR